MKRIKETEFGTTTHSGLAQVTTNELRVLENNPAVVGTHMLTWASVVLLLDNCVHINVAITVGAKQDINNLLACP